MGRSHSGSSGGLVASEDADISSDNMGENPIHRKHTGFFATLVSGELGGPKSHANHTATKGKLVNIPAHSM